MAFYRQPGYFGQFMDILDALDGIREQTRDLMHKPAPSADDDPTVLKFCGTEAAQVREVLDGIYAAFRFGDPNGLPSGPRRRDGGQHATMGALTKAQARREKAARVKKLARRLRLVK